MNKLRNTASSWLDEQISTKAIELRAGLAPASFRLLLDGKLYSSEKLTPVAYYASDNVDEWEQETDTICPKIDLPQGVALKAQF